MPFCLRGIERAGQNQTRPAYYYFSGSTPPIATYTANLADIAYWGMSYVHMGYQPGSFEGPAMVSYTITPVSGPGGCTSADPPPPPPNPDPNPGNSYEELKAQIQNLSAKLNNLQANVLLKRDKSAIVDQSVSLAAPLAAGLVVANVTPKIAAAQATAAGAAAGVAKLSPLLGLLGAVGSILSLLSLPAALNVLGGRIDAVEGWTASLDRAVSGAINLAGKGLKQANEAAEIANRALNRAMTPGPKGDRGIRGLRGMTGLKGDRGIPGLRGMTGLKGDRGISGLRGMTGLKGDRGIPGLRGMTGLKGDRGISGLRGMTGLKGDRGIPGLRGMTGLKGDPGQKGEFNMAELAAINSSLAAIALGVAANNAAIKKVPVEIIDNNTKLATDTIPSKMQEKLCEELTNGKCFPNAMTNWLNGQPLAKVPAQVQAITPVVVNTGSIVNNIDNKVNNIDNTINNIDNTINNIDNTINNIDNTINNIDNTINNIDNTINNIDNTINNIDNTINDIDNNINNNFNNINNNIGGINNNIGGINNNIGGINNNIGGINNNLNLINVKLDKPEIKWQTIEVPVIVCTFKDGAWTPETSKQTINIIATDTGNEAEKIFNLYEEIKKANVGLCLAKNKKEETDKECCIAVPDMWLIRPEHSRSQVCYSFAEVDSTNNIIGSPKYSIIIPHHIPSKPNTPLSIYQKGNFELIYVLRDNSKITIHGFNQSENLKILEEIKLRIIPEYLNGAYLSKNSEIFPKTPLQTIRVKCTRAVYWSEGRKNNKPDWVKKFA
ncbi:MAG: collagen-like protein [Dolichospermum sp. DEX182a]|nr:collagen-like protein [Dolichospermum sp. DEX182a]